MPCDFCSEPNPTWTYPAEDFVALSSEFFTQESVGPWDACEMCHRLIEHNDRTALAIRALDRLILARPDMILCTTELLDELRGLHELFFLHRTGDPVSRFTRKP
jgi:hypothetical protein